MSEELRVYQVQSSTNPYDYHWTVIAGSEDEAKDFVRATADDPEHRAYANLLAFDIGDAAVKGVKE